MGGTLSTAHRSKICRALYLHHSINKFISRDKSSSTSANELSRQWAVPHVQPIASKFAERCI